MSFERKGSSVGEGRLKGVGGSIGVATVDFLTEEVLKALTLDFPLGGIFLEFRILGRRGFSTVNHRLCFWSSQVAI